ncbi:MAG: efflux RND transporter permease subunit [Saprospiraceae bacterium]|nr:efflux RND transporter permease subunit [Saprospiraceae bacterium]
MKGIVTYFIKYPVAANLLMFALLIMGVAGITNMKSTFFPEVESRVISIQLVYPGASPEELQEGGVNKIEENLKGVTGVERVTSVSRENSGTVTVEIFKGYDTDNILQDVKNAVDRISSFPVGMEPPVIYKLENLGRAINFAVSGEIDLKTLKIYARKIEEDLLAKEGISKVELSGFPEEEIEIAFRERDLRAYNLTFTQAASAVRNANLEITGGTIRGDQEELLLRARNKSYTAEGFRDIIVKNNAAGAVIRLHQVADINDRWSENNPSRSFVNGRPAVVVTVQNTLEEDMLSIVEMVKAYISDFNTRENSVEAIIIEDASVVLKQRIGLLTENGILGFVIVIILLAMFLHWRLAFWVALAIPISFGGMFICASLLGVTINVISLFGMILVVGILVDDGIVIGESIYQEYEKGATAVEAAVNGTMKVLPAVFTAILTTVIAFSTFFFIDGRLGDFFLEMAIVVIFSLTFSLIEGAFILPTHVAHSKALQPNRQANRIQQRLEQGLNWLRTKTYEPILRFAMHNKFLTLSIFIGLLTMTYGAINGGIISGTFFPVIERDNLNIKLQMPAGTREHITMEWLDHIEKAAQEANQELSQQYFNNEKQAILRIEKNLGPTTYQGSLNIAILDGENRDSLRLRDVTNAIRQKAGSIQAAEVVTYGGAGTFGKPVSVSLVGDDYAALKDATNAVKNEMNQLTELADVVDNNQEGLREINISLNDKGRYLGLNLQEVLAQVRSGFFGNEAQRLQRGRDEVRVWVRYAQENRSDITELETMRVRFADGRSFPLGEIANFDRERGVVSINHIEGKREIKVEADISSDDVSVSDITSNLKEVIIPEVLANYPSVSALYEGQNREQEKSTQSIQSVGIIILALMFFSVALTFRSVSQSLVVFLLIPFSIIGVGWGHWLMNAPISLFSILGVIALIGVLVNDSLVLVTTYNSYLEEDKSQMEAVFLAGSSRFRPIVLTTFTTFAGLAPLLFEKSLQAQFLIPMAISVSYGLLAVTVVNLLLLPVFLIVANRFKVYASWLWNGVRPSNEAVEAAIRQDTSYEYLWYAFFVVIGIALAFSFFGNQIVALLT